MYQRYSARVVISLIFAMVFAMAPVESWDGTVQAAPAAQELRAKTVTGTLPGGEFAKIWLGLVPDVPEADITIEIEFDRPNALNTGLGFYVLSPEGLSRVQGGSRINDVDLVTSGPVFQQPDNILGARFTSFGLSNYTVVPFNDSNDAANFTLRVTNATLIDGSNQVTDPSAPVVDEAAEVTAEGSDDATDLTATAAVTTTEAAPVEEAPAAAAPAPVATTAVTPTVAATVAAPPGVPGVVRSTTMEGVLAESEQHFLALEPEGRDVDIKIDLEINPSDNSVLARRLNFWVMDRTGFERYLNGARPSDVAVAAGNRVFDGQANERNASFKSVGSGAYTVLVYNNAPVEGNYVLTVVGGTLSDDSGQTLTAQRSASSAVTSTAATTTTATTSTAATTAATTTGTSATITRQAAAGETYTVQTGDTISLIARDVLGDVQLYDELCAFNNIADCDRIEVGDEILIPTQAQLGTLGASTTAAPAAQPTVAPVATTAVTTTAAVTETTTTTETTSSAAEPAATPTPQPETESAASTTTATTAPATGDDILDVAEATGNFNLFVAAIEAAGLSDVMRSAGPFTVFAPTDAAFTNLPDGTLDALLADPAGQLTDILLYHVVPGKILAEDVQDRANVQSAQGSTVRFGVTDDRITINDANIVSIDLQASNGVIHVIDSVLSPPEESAN